MLQRLRRPGNEWEDDRGYVLVWIAGAMLAWVFLAGILVGWLTWG